jgi:hypothetical protein
MSFSCGAQQRVNIALVRQFLRIFQQTTSSSNDAEVRDVDDGLPIRLTMNAVAQRLGDFDVVEVPSRFHFGQQWNVPTLPLFLLKHLRS